MARYIRETPRIGTVPGKGGFMISVCFSGVERVTFVFITDQRRLVPAAHAKERKQNASEYEDSENAARLLLNDPDPLWRLSEAQVSARFGIELIERYFKLISMYYENGSYTAVPFSEETFRVVAVFSREKGARRHRYQFAPLQPLLDTTAGEMHTYIDKGFHCGIVCEGLDPQVRPKAALCLQNGQLSFREPHLPTAASQ